MSGIRSELAERFDEARRLRRNDDVACEREVGARAGGNAVHGADHRHRQRPQREDERLVVAVDRCAEIDRRLARGYRAIRQVLPGTESAAGAGDQQYARRCVAAHTGERVAHFGMHRIVEAVETIGAIERQPRDAGVLRKQDVLVTHRRGPRARRVRRAADSVPRGTVRRRMRRRSTPRWLPDWRRCRENRRTPPID